MRLGIFASYSSDFRRTAAEIADYDKLGLDVAAVAEAYSFDAVSQLGYLAAKTENIRLQSGILAIYSRTPTLTAMTAAGLDFVSNGRFELGLGASGPQVVEGFHGLPYTAPLGRTREVIDICRAVWRRERIEHSGQHYRIPLPAEEGTGLGKPLKLINTPLRERIPISLAAIGPKNVALAAEIAEGWNPIFFAPERAHLAWGQALAEGKSLRKPDLGELDVIVTVAFALGDGAEQHLDAVKPQLALYIGGMGARGKNFYNDLACRYGYEGAAAEIQDHYLAGRRDAAVAAVPDELARAVSLIGTEDEVREQLDAFSAAGVTTLMLNPLAGDPGKRIDQVGRLRALVAN
ncbi:LLM class F420-dependent oxidoreductase [Amycolatopsis echigonensis]|uniref:LLM class F420-dependent oxidoreductase n=1 Tax=Amycolatopsis echigonensis TaxID=2576905 RepID=A0A8E1W8U4_9PSEU|nr:LLM class F420-dependent oxidoreductase [Amycolatopsis echigonensis]MBB2506246.1 LLM class F420-dependent oxidoreductase [Amycolatopsis echigonensis]